MRSLYKKITSSITIKNGIWLYILQFFNTVFPLLTLPYVTRILGTNNYGIFSYALNIITYLQVIVEYGFNLSGARKIAICDNEKEIEKIYSKIVTTKILLLFLSLIILIPVIILSNFTIMQIYTIGIMFCIVLGTSITQTWVFQGKQKMKFVTISNVIIRFIFMILIFTLVKNENDLYLYSFLYAIAFVVIGIVQTIIISKMLRYKLKWCKFKECIDELKDGWYTFTTSAISKIYVGIGVTLLGIINGANASVVGIYSAIQKIPMVINMAYAPIGQAIFPYISKKYKTDKTFAIKFINKLVKLTFLCLLVVIILTVFFSRNIINIVFGEEYTEYHTILIPLVIWAFLGILNNILGIQVLVAQGKNKEYSRAFFIGSISIIGFNLILGIPFGVYGVSISVMLAELLLSILLIREVYWGKEIKE